MNFQEAVQSGFSNYAKFRGRAARSEFWWWQLFIVLGGIAAAVLDLLANSNVLGGEPLATLFWLATIIPGLAVGVRRLHDTDSSGWWLLLGLIPLIGIIVLIVWLVSGGLEGLQPVRARSASAGAE